MSSIESCISVAEPNAAARIWSSLDGPTSLEIPLRFVAAQSPRSTGMAALQPLSCGIPLPKGRLRWPLRADCNGLPFAVHGAQTTPLATWSDGSLRWVLLELLAAGVSADSMTGAVRLVEDTQDGDRAPAHVSTDNESWTLSTTGLQFIVSRRSLEPFLRVRHLQDIDNALWCGQVRMIDNYGRLQIVRTDAALLESTGSLRTTIRLDGHFVRSRGLRFRARLSVFRQTGLVRLDVCVHNSNRARHRGGLWDLGDRGSRYFEELSVDLRSSAANGVVRWQTEPQGTIRDCPSSELEIHQDSSGGENWQSPNHVNRHGRVPCRFRGYRERSTLGEGAGLRSSPTVAFDDGQITVAVALPEFWQQFPKSIEASTDGLRVGLFPRQWGDVFELQGGERKTHTVWMLFEPSACAAGIDGLAWVHWPARISPAAEWVAASGAIPELPPTQNEASAQLDRFVASAIDGPRSFYTGRERIDEYGWRNYGDIWADHEGAYYTGKAPIISHYNNQFDVVYGAILQWLRTADIRWWDILDPLARHVMDIDIYHTEQDRAAYSGGLFWFTDHYLDAQTATHRTYSRSNRPNDGRAYGGGPGSEHNFATGLLHYYYLTGNEDARQAVLGLGDWVIRMDDGQLSPFGWMDDGATGLASAHWNGSKMAPGRGGANSLQVLLDAWLLSKSDRYIMKAEELIRRCIHPADDVASMDLLDAEKHWSYTMFLAALTRYLSVKAEAEQLDAMYAYAQSSLLHYAKWMLEHERPYFVARERLEYPTETWPAQDLRKANVLRQAARHADAEFRAALIRRGNELAEQSWRDLLSCEYPWTARAQALVMIEGTRDAFCGGFASESFPRLANQHDFTERTPFIPQKPRVRRQLCSLSGLVRAAGRLLSFRWRNRIPANFANGRSLDAKTP